MAVHDPASDAMCWRVEAACLNAWPSSRQIILDGWLLRASGGPTRRLNSANPLHRDAAASEPLIEAVEAFYQSLGRTPIFRVPDISPPIDALLAERGYAADAHTRTLWADMADLPTQPNEGKETALIPHPDARWLSARDRLSGNDDAARLAYRETVAAILLPCGFAMACQAGDIKAVAYGALQGDLLIVESVVSDPAVRRQGFARQCLLSLFGWARAQGARAAALQVMADNVPALALYRGLGFTRDLYGYHYRIKRS